MSASTRDATVSEEVLDDVRAAVRSLLAERCSWQAVLSRTESPEPYDGKLWSVLAAGMGLAGLAIPERFGGGGAGFAAAGAVLEELGRAVAPVPYLGSAVVATRALLAAEATGGAAQSGQSVAGELLTRLAGGAAVAALAVPFPAGPFDDLVHVAADGDLLTGRITSVAGALPATDLLVLADGGVFAVDAGHPGVRRTPVVSLDATRALCDIELTAAPGRRLARGHDAARAGLLTGAALLASEQVGVAQWCLDATVRYAKERYQFGRPIGSFQAVKHRLADVWVEVTQAREVAAHAAARPDDPVAAALAQAYCGPAAQHAARECVQLHGGIGFTWEHPAHLYLKRATADGTGLGTADRHRAALARLVDLPGPIDGSIEKSTLLV